MASFPNPKTKHPRRSASPNPNLRRSASTNLIPRPTINNDNPIDSVLQLFLDLPDASSVSLDLSFDRLLETRTSDEDRHDFIQRALTLGSLLVEAGNRSARKLSSLHNAVVWYLPFDLTVKVFSFLDTQSVCYAAATCSLFNKCAADPACYADIDLTGIVPNVNNVVVSTMIQRAGSSLRSLKLGIVCDTTSSAESPMTLVCSGRKSKDALGFSWNKSVTTRFYPAATEFTTNSREGKESFVLTRSCLMPLSVDGGSIGALLRRLHLYQIGAMDNASLCTALSCCPSLIDLGIVSLDVDLCQALESVIKFCSLLEHLYLDSSETVIYGILGPPTCADLVKNCPRIYSLALRGFELDDSAACILVKGFRNLMFLDLSTSSSITGSFLKNINGDSGGNFLEVLILRDCFKLKQMEVTRFLSTVISGELKYLRYLDISNEDGLASEGESHPRMCDTRSIPVAELLEKRPNLILLSEFPSRPVDMEETSDSDVDIYRPIGSEDQDEEEDEDDLRDSSVENSDGWESYL